MHTDRRQFVGMGAAAAAGAGLTAAAATAQNAGGTATPNLYPNEVARQLRAFLKHENAHVAAITALIQQIGGTPRPRPNFRNLEPANARAFATLTRTFANTGSGAYRAGGPVIFSRTVLAAAGSIALIESRHSGYINSALNLIETTDVFGNEQQFEQPLTQDQVLNLSAPFIQDLNGGPPARFNLTPSRANDIAILNFALILEYLEQTFYTINLPRFFPEQGATQ